MPLIQVTMIEGRDLATKASLLAELTAAAVSVLEAPAHTVRVIISEVPAANWGVEGEPLSIRLKRMQGGQS